MRLVLTGRLERMRRARADRGSAVVEFLGAGLLLLVPLVYLVLVLAQLQAGVFAAEAAAREAGRIVAGATDLGRAEAQAVAAVELAFADQGLAVDGTAALEIQCAAHPCLTPGEPVHVVVGASVDLPLVPAFLRAAVPVQVPVQAAHLAVVDPFTERP